MVCSLVLIKDTAQELPEKEHKEATLLRPYVSENTSILHLILFQNIEIYSSSEFWEHFLHCLLDLGVATEKTDGILTLDLLY